MGSCGYANGVIDGFSVGGAQSCENKLNKLCGPTKGNVFDLYHMCWKKPTTIEVKVVVKMKSQNGVRLQHNHHRNDRLRHHHRIRRQ